MSLQPQEIKQKRKTMIKTGVHLVLIHDIEVLRNAAKQPILLDGKNPSVIVTFKNDQSEIFQQEYLLDKDWKQETFEKMLTAAGLTVVKGQSVKKAEALNKRLWIAIREIHYYDGNIQVMEDGQPKIEYFIFKTIPYIDGASRPALLGDPFLNNAEPADQFINFRNVHSGNNIEVKAVKAPKGEVKSTVLPEEPTFDAPTFVQQVEAEVVAQIKKDIEVLESGPAFKVEMKEEYLAPKFVTEVEAKEEKPFNWDDTPTF